MNEEPRWTGGRDSIGGVAPALAHYTDAILFDEVWERPGLSKRDRSLVTVTALITIGAVDQLRFHIGFAQTNGVTQEEIIEAITQLAFYVGWPRAMSAVAVAREVFSAE